MAVLPATAATPGSSSKSHASSARFRQRKISVKQPLAIYKQKELSVSNGDELEHSQINHLSTGGSEKRETIETGVDKNEEDEVHLQQVINAAQRALLHSGSSSDSSVYIPTPDASQKWPDAVKYYSDQKYIEPESYVKFSATVEDAVSVLYCMDDEDETFFKSLTSPKKGVTSISELEYETVCDHFERAIEQKQPFLSMDVSMLMPYKELEQAILSSLEQATPLKDKLSTELSYSPFITLFDKHHDQPKRMEHVRPLPDLLKWYGSKIYEFWSQRKKSRGGKSIHPQLKFEDPSATDKENDNDPYICFRRREFRQARKTRRADTLGAERLRHLQRSLQQARELVLQVAQREILKIELYEQEAKVFRSRVDTKAAKRAAQEIGDEHLFYPVKRQRVVVKQEDREQRRKRDIKDPKSANGSVSQPSSKERPSAPPSSSTSQPYVKLPPAKIPDMDLVSVQLVLKEKHDTIKRAVAEKLRKRREQDKGYVNLTDDPNQPWFSVASNPDVAAEVSHIPYSSIAAASYHDIHTANYINDAVKRVVEDERKALPGVRTIKGGKVVPSVPFSSTVSPPVLTDGNTAPSYVGQFLHNIDTNNFNAYSVGYGEQWRQQQQRSSASSSSQPLSATPFMRLRKRHGRGGIFVDRRGQVPFVDIGNDEDDDEDDGKNNSSVKNVYNSADTSRRMASRWRFDNDMAEDQRGMLEPFGHDPSRLNSISDDTQSIRFGSMLLSKSYGLLRESVHQRQQMFLQQARLRALQQPNKQTKVVKERS